MPQPSRRTVLAGAASTVVASGLGLAAGSDAAPFTLASRADTLARFGARRPTYWGLNAPGTISRFSTSTRAGRGAVVLTFDACGGHVTKYDSALVETLRRYRVPATLFVNRTWATNNPAIFRSLLADPLFEIENHGWSHQPLSVTGRSAYGIAGTRNLSEVWTEVASAHWYYATTYEHRTRFMRAGTAYTDDVAAAAARYMGQPVVSFSVNVDGGASFPASTVEQQLLTVRPGDITLAHFNHPEGGTAAGVARALPTLLTRGVVFRRLAEVV